MFVGNAYEAKDVPRVPYSLHEAVETFRGSTVAREAFGDFVFEHLLNTAHQEQVIFDNTTRHRLGARPLLRARVAITTMTPDPELDAILRSVPGWADAELEVEPLDGGITNRNYVVRTDGQAYVLRVPGRDTELLGIDRANELRAARVAAEAGVGPEVVAFLPELGSFVSRFVPGAHIPMEDLRAPEVLGSVVASLRRLHACPPIPSSFNAFRIVETYFATVEPGVSPCRRPTTKPTPSPTGSRTRSKCRRRRSRPVTTTC